MKPLDVKCPRCYSPSGIPCYTVRLGALIAYRKSLPHKARRDAAHVATAAHRVKCPECGRGPGYLCGFHTPSGICIDLRTPHAARVRAAEEGPTR